MARRTKTNRFGWVLPVGIALASAFSIRLLRGGPIPAIAEPGPWKNGAPWPPLDDAPEPAASTIPTNSEATPPAPVLNAQEPASQPWMLPIDGQCPEGYPIKLKIKSGIFHVPGGLSYDRTKPDRCYRSVDDALTDGHRQAKR